MRSSRYLFFLFTAALLVLTLVWHCSDNELLYPKRSQPASKSGQQTNTNSATAIARASSPQKAVVLAAHEGQDIAWLDELVDWSSHVYTFNTTAVSSIDNLTVAQAYLSFLIEFYENLPKTVAFVHQLQRHTRDRNALSPKAIVISLTHLRTDAIQRRGYSDLICASAHDFQRQCSDQHTPIEQLMHVLIATTSKSVNPRRSAGSMQFAASREQMRRRERSYYKRVLASLETNDQDLEGEVQCLWPLVFAADGVEYEDEETCWCELYEPW